MLAIDPITLDYTSLDYSSAVDDPAWLIGTTYALDAVVSVDALRYKSLIAGNVGYAPATSPLQWLLLGPTNKMAMFDTSPTSVTRVTSGNLQVRFTPASRVTAVGLLLVIGSRTTLRIYESKAAFDAGAAWLYDVPQSMATSDGTYYSWCFEPLQQRPDVSFLSLPSVGVGTYFVLTIEPAGGVAECGLCAFGRQYDLGTAEYGFAQSAELRGRSYFDSAGNPVRLDRGYRKNISGTLVVPKANYNRVQNFLQERIGVPMLWILSPTLADYRSAIMFGDYERTNMAIDNSVSNSLDVEINGYY
jgi:hypothetical protein